MGERMDLLDADELRQEGEKEDRELGVQDVDQDRLDGDLERRAGADDIFLPYFCRATLLRIGFCR
jgi:hypothetical protein